jgi:MFS family permease
MATSTVWRLVPALGIAQIISWGTLYYSIAVLGGSMRRDLNLSETALFGAYSLSLLLSGLAAPLAGRAIDHLGGRVVLTAGSLTAAVALLWIAHAHSLLSVYCGWALAGIAMAMTLYDAAFATLSQHTGTSYRTALTALTLMGGLASTVFWPLSLTGMEWFGWRDTMTCFAALQILVCLPLHLAFVPRGASPSAPGKAGAAHEEGSVPPRSRRTALVALAITFALNGFIVSVLTVHLISMFQGKGLTLATAVWLGSFFGPMQVAGRILEFSFGRRYPSRQVGLIALSLLVAAVGVLLALNGQLVLALAFAVLFGFSNGVVTIVRGTVPAELFGRAGYGSTLGILAAPALLARALAPLAFAPLASAQTAAFGWLLTLLVMALFSVTAFAFAATRR